MLIALAHRLTNIRHTGAFGSSSTPRLFGAITDAPDYWIARFRGR